LSSLEARRLLDADVLTQMHDEGMLTPHERKVVSYVQKFSFARKPAGAPSAASMNVAQHSQVCEAMHPARVHDHAFDIPAS
jgi:hypothetical protein